MLENKQNISEPALVLAIRAASNVGEAVFARELLMLHSKAEYRPQKKLYICVSFGGRRLCCLFSKVWCFVHACVLILIFHLPKLEYIWCIRS